jgi:hypothetical protein
MPWSLPLLSQNSVPGGKNSSGHSPELYPSPSFAVGTFRALAPVSGKVVKKAYVWEPDSWPVMATAVSFVHIEHLAVTDGQTLLAALLLPLSIDGTVAAASLVMLRAARADLGTPRLARFMLALAVTATMAANVGYGLPFGVAGALISGWPAIAFVGSVEMVIGMVRRTRPSAIQGGPRASRRGVPESNSALNGSASWEISRSASGGRTRHSTKRTPATAEDAEHEFMAELASGALPSLRSIRARMHVGQGRGRALRDHLESVTIRAEAI